MPSFSQHDANQLLQGVFAPWIQELKIVCQQILPDGVLLRMPFSERLCREGGIVCGQAFMALADTAMVIAVAAQHGAYRPMTTVDMSSHMMRPIAQSDITAHARVLRMGRTMAFGHIVLHPADDDRPAVSATAAYALLSN